MKLSSYTLGITGVIMYFVAFVSLVKGDPATSLACIGCAIYNQMLSDRFFKE